MDDDALFKVPEMSKGRKNSRRMSVQSLDIPINFMRKRKRHQDDDTMSIASMDSVEGAENLNSSTLSLSSSKKRRNSLRRMSNSLINMFSPVKNKVQRTPSLRQRNGNPGTPKCSTPAYKPPEPTPTKRRATSTWSDTMARGKRPMLHMSQRLIKHQEAIYELYQGEKDITSDLKHLRKTYRDPMITLKLITAEEASTIFGAIDQLIPVHQDLTRRLEEQKQTDGTTQSVGEQILNWVPQLSVYVKFCGNQRRAKALLDTKRQSSPEVEKFLDCCQMMPDSRKLDLWALLDGARQRFMKYPLLIKAIQKETPDDHEDIELLNSALSQLDEIIAEADRMTGTVVCEFHKTSLRFTNPKQNIPEIEESTVVVCQGTLKNTKGNKVQLCLFNKAAVVSRSVSQGQQVLQNPIPVAQLVVEDLSDGEVRSGSFRNVVNFGHSTSKNVFRISFKDNKQGRSHTLVATDEHSKQMWMQSFQTLTCHIVRKGPSTTDKK